MGRILVVDDDALIREMLKDILVEKGHELFLAQSALSGIKLLLNEDIDLVLLDVMMPAESGLDMLPQIKSLNSDISVIIMTAYASTDSAIEAMRNGAQGFVKKPFKPDELQHFIDMALDRKRLIVENKVLMRRLEYKVKMLTLCQETANAISSILELDPLLEQVAKRTCDLIGAEASSVLLWDDKTNELVFHISSGKTGTDIQSCRLKSGQGIAGWVFQQKKAVIISDVASDERFCEICDNETGFVTKSIIAVPLIIKKKGIGVIEVVNKSGGGEFEQSDLQAITAIAMQIAIAIENANMTESLKKSHNQIEDYNKNLEFMVEERTSALQNTNTVLKTTQAQLIQAEKMSSLGQLAAGIAHEINNPTAFISSNLRTLKDYVTDIMQLTEQYEGIIVSAKKGAKASFINGLKGLEETKKKIDLDFLRGDTFTLIDQSLDGTYRVQKIVQDLKTFSRPGDAELKKSDIHAMLDSTLNIVCNEIKYKADIIKDYGDIPLVYCVPTQINQVFMNLLVNAAHAIEGRGEIVIKTSSNKEKVTIEISDNGSGISDSHIDKIFDPFFTTKEPGKGTGLGLPIAYNIIKKHKGEIIVKSRPGKGTVFKIELPLKITKKRTFT